MAMCYPPAGWPPAVDERTGGQGVVDKVSRVEAVGSNDQKIFKKAKIGERRNSESLGRDSGPPWSILPL